MAKILCVMSDVRGPLYAQVELARRLSRAGHRLTCAGSPDAREVVTLQGLDFLPLPPSGYSDFLAADERRPRLERLRNLKSRRQQALDAWALEEFLSAARALDPDLILIDGEMHEVVFAVAALEAKVALLNCFVSIWRRPGLPPPHNLARPGVGLTGSKIGIWLLWRRLWLKKRRRALTQKLRFMGCDRLSLLRALGQESGFDLRRETDDSQWLIPFTYRRLPVLSLHAREFEFPHQPPAGVHYVGPMLLENRGDEAMGDAARGELEKLIERRRAGQARVIYAGFGSFLTAELDFLRRLADAVAETDDLHLVISLGGRMDPKDLGPLPERAIAFRWLPQLEVLRHSDVAVVHGGINTLDECVLNGVPMLVYCGFETDMAGNTSRVVHHGLGIAGDRRDGPREIRQHIGRLLGEPHFAYNLERLRASYAAYADDRVAERVVESLLE